MDGFVLVAAGVFKGQQFLRGGGHENCALAAIGTAR